MKIQFWALLILALTIRIALADTPPPGTVKIKDSSGNAIDATGGSLNVNVTGTSATQPVSGSVSVTNFPATQPVSAASLPLPAGASTSALQTSGNSSLSSIDTKLGGTLSVDASGHTVPVSGTFWQATQPISASSLPLPAGAATAANQATANSSLASIDSKLTSPLTANTNLRDGSGNAIGSSGGALNVAITSGGGTNPSVGATGAAVPASANFLGAQDGSGNLLGLRASTGGALKIDGSGFTQPVSGSVSVSNFPGTQTVSGSVSVSNFPATQPVSAASLPLPSGASTSALQTSGNSSLSSLDSKLPAKGQAAMAASTPVVIASDQSAIPITGSITATNSANGNTGSAVPAQATQVAGSDGTNLRALKVSSAGVLSVDGSAVTQPVSGTFWQTTQPVSAASLPLPSGASTSALQTTGNTSLSSIDSKIPASLTVSSTRLLVDGSGVTQPVSGTFWQATQPVSAASLPLPSGAATSAKQPALGTAGSASADVISIQGITGMTAVKVDGSAVTQPVSGTVGVSGTVAVSAASLPLPSGAATDASVTETHGSKAPGTAASKSELGGGVYNSSGVTLTDGQQAALQLGSSGALKIDGSGFTQPVSASSLPLPTGAATAANQSTANSSLSSIDSKVPVNLTVSSTRLLVDGSGVTQPVSGTVTANAGSGTFAVSAASLPLPSGAATSAKQPALGTAGTASSDVITVQGIASMTALKVDGSAVTQPVSAASLPLPSGAATAAKQPALGTAGTPSSDVITVQGATSMTALKVDGSAVTQPVSAASLPLPSGAATSANQTTANTSLSSIDSKVPANLTVSSTRLLVDGSGVTQPVSAASALPTKAPVNTNGSMSTSTVVGSSGTTTLTAPANAVGFVLEASSSNAQNIRWAIGTTPTTSSGLRLEPGRDTGYIPGAANILVIAESGSSQEVQVQWILSQ
jgi:hypothetical protein